MPNGEQAKNEALKRLIRTLQDAKSTKPENQPSVLIDMDALGPATDLDGNVIETFVRKSFNNDGSGVDKDNTGTVN